MEKDLAVVSSTPCDAFYQTLICMEESMDNFENCLFADSEGSAW